MEGGVGASRPQFVKALIPGFSKRMLIPRHFTERLACENHRTATILSPLGKFWHVSIERDGHDMYFGNGWKEFTEAHDLCVGYFLVFCHEGNMVFTVKVFDWSGCLKEYNEIAGRFSEETKTTVEEDQAIDNASKSDIRKGVDSCHLQYKAMALILVLKEIKKMGKALRIFDGCFVLFGLVSTYIIFSVSAFSCEPALYASVQMPSALQSRCLMTLQLTFFSLALAPSLFAEIKEQLPKLEQSLPITM